MHILRNMDVFPTTSSFVRTILINMFFDFFLQLMCHVQHFSTWTMFCFFDTEGLEGEIGDDN